MPIKTLLADSGFDPEAVTALVYLFESAWQTLVASQSPLVEADVAAATRERLARQVILLWRRGERDRLVDLALASLDSEEPPGETKTHPPE